MSNFFAGVAALISIGTSLFGISQSKKASDYSRQADAERRKASQVQSRINEQKFMKDRIFRLAEARKERGAIKAKQIATSSAGGSSRGVIGGVQTQAASNFGFQTNIFNLGQEMGANLFSAAVYDTSANQALAKGQRVKAYGEIGKTIFS